MGLDKMTEEQFKAIYPQIYEWIRQTLASNTVKAKTVDSVGFRRLPLYFNQDLLSTTKFVEQFLSGWLLNQSLLAAQ